MFGSSPCKHLVFAVRASEGANTLCGQFCNCNSVNRYFSYPCGSFNAYGNLIPAAESTVSPKGLNHCYYGLGLCFSFRYWSYCVAYHHQSNAACQLTFLV